MRLTRSALSFVSAMTVILLAAACGNLFNGPLTFTIAFEDGLNLRPGHFVFYRGVRVGEVEAVDLKSSVDVAVAIEREHAEAMHRGLSFFIEKSDIVSAERRIVAYDCGAVAGGLIDRGDRVQGSDGWGAWMACKAKEQLTPLADRLSTLIEQAGGSETGRALISHTHEMTAKASELGRLQYEEFRRKTLPGIQERAEQYKRELENDGRLNEASQFWEHFLLWLADVQRDREQ